ncbi:MAG TPA: hypothetical protein VFS74_00845 [Gemmatimonadales bacterium]|jgi:hypothetical protein|nr:hypothetical protein [Gemmatimonadales bacterium]
MSGEMLPLRVRVQDVWEEIPMEADAALSVAELKRDALDRLRIRRDPAGYVVKFRGAELFNEAGSLKDAGVVANANLIVLPRRRRPVG